MPETRIVNEDGSVTVITTAAAPAVPTGELLATAREEVKGLSPTGATRQAIEALIDAVENPS